MSWFEVGRTEEKSPGFELHTVGRERVVVALIDGELFAFSAFCPHARGPMHLAETQGATITCPLHGWTFELRDDGRELHGYDQLSMYDVQVREGVIYVEVPDKKAPRQPPDRERANLKSAAERLQRKR